MGDSLEISFAISVISIALQINLQIINYKVMPLPYDRGIIRFISENECLIMLDEKLKGIRLWLIIAHELRHFFQIKNSMLIPLPCYKYQWLGKVYEYPLEFRHKDLPYEKDAYQWSKDWVKKNYNYYSKLYRDSISKT